MAAQKTHILRALAARRKAQDAHHAQAVRQAGLQATAQTLAQGATAAAKLPAHGTITSRPGG